MERLIQKLSMSCRSDLDLEKDKEKEKQLQNKVKGKVSRLILCRLMSYLTVFGPG